MNLDLLEIPIHIDHYVSLGFESFNLTWCVLPEQEDKYGIVSLYLGQVIWAGLASKQTKDMQKMMLPHQELLSDWCRKLTDQKIYQFCWLDFLTRTE